MYLRTLVDDRQAPDMLTLIFFLSISQPSDLRKHRRKVLNVLRYWFRKRNVTDCCTLHFEIPFCNANLFSRNS